MTDSVLFHGPPASGKSHYAAKVARDYYLPHIKIGTLAAVLFEVVANANVQVM